MPLINRQKWFGIFFAIGGGCGSADRLGVVVEEIVDETDVQVTPASINTSSPYNIFAGSMLVLLPGSSGRTLVATFTDTAQFRANGSIAGWAWSGNGGSSWSYQTSLPRPPDVGSIRFPVISDPVVATSPSADPKTLPAVWAAMTTYKNGLVWGRFGGEATACASLPGAPSVCPNGNTVVIYEAPGDREADRPALMMDAQSNSHLVFTEALTTVMNGTGRRVHYLRINPAGVVTADCVLPRAADSSAAEGFKAFENYPQYAQVGVTGWGGIVVSWGEFPNPLTVPPAGQVDGRRYYIHNSVGLQNGSGTCPISWGAPAEVATTLTTHLPRIESWADWDPRDTVSALAGPAGVLAAPRAATMYTVPLVVNKQDDHCYLAYRTRVSAAEPARLVVVQSADGLTWNHLSTLDTKPFGLNPGARAYQPTLATDGNLVTAAWYDDRDSPPALPHARLSVYAARFVVDSGFPFEPAFRVSRNTAVASGTFFPTPPGGNSTPYVVPLFWMGFSYGGVRARFWGDHISMVLGVGRLLPLVGWVASPSQAFVSWTDSSRTTTSDTAQPSVQSQEIRGSRIDVTP